MAVRCEVCDVQVKMTYVALIGGRRSRSGRCQSCGIYYCNRGHRMYDERKGWGTRKDSYGEVRPYPFCTYEDCGRANRAEDKIRQLLRDSTDKAALRQQVRSERDAAPAGSWKREVLNRAIREHPQLW